MPRQTLPMDMATRVAKTLAELRLREHLTQEDAAQKAGVTVRQWQRWETGESRPRAASIARISAAFDIPATDFFEAPPNGDGLHARLELLGERLAAVEECLRAIAAHLEVPTTMLQAFSDGQASAEAPARQPQTRRRPRTR